ncbi:thiol peroxidase [Bergeyella zoohelcum]|uniref:Thiol peroxidase n=1 Tax=Bergeyella zoohelcum TaxID=1015 RepID=A0A7Z8YLG6_9FLAO|nr:thiol peroxidase [Bergeyella zoohelcum]VDH02552.1 thiol peroxidase [Bergeyella zoohelcum]
MANITLKGNAISTKGELPTIGSELKDFTLVNDKLEDKNLNDYKGKKLIFNIFPSIDTGVCAASARKFNQEASSVENTVILNVSKDLPFALGRFCAAEGLDRVETLSDFRGSFGDDFGVTIENGPLAGLMSRAIIVTDEEGKIIYTEQVPEITQEPDYEKALNAVK